MLNDVPTGLVDARKVRVTYAILGPPAHEDVFHPYTLILHNHALYVVGFSERAQARRMLALERIRKTAWRDQRELACRDDYDPRREIGDAFGICVVR